MAQSTPAISFASLKQSLAKGQFAPVYLLHGEEAYYADELIKLFDSIIPESDRDFNMYTIYAPESSPEAIADTCRRFPMMADRQVVIVKELQTMKANEMDRLSEYAGHPTPTTLLVLCSRGAAVKSKELLAAVKSGGGVIFESKKLTEKTIDPSIVNIAREAGLNIEPKGVAMLRDFIGTDLARLYNEINKMAMVLPAGATITPESIERNIGISKDFNNFELIDAIATKNAPKIFRIVDYFRSNPKNNPTVLTASTIFNYFSNLLIVHFTRDKSPSSLMGALGLKWQSQVRNYETGARNYNAYKVIEILSAIRRFDANSKGIGSRQQEYDLLHDLMFRILTAPGQIVI